MCGCQVQKKISWLLAGILKVWSSRLCSNICVLCGWLRSLFCNSQLHKPSQDFSAEALLFCSCDHWQFLLRSLAMQHNIIWTKVQYSVHLWYEGTLGLFELLCTYLFQLTPPYPYTIGTSGSLFTSHIMFNLLRSVYIYNCSALHALSMLFVGM